MNDTTNNGSEELLTVREVAQKLRVDETTVRRWITSGSMEGVTLPHLGKRVQYRIRRSVFDEVMNGKNGARPHE